MIRRLLTLVALSASTLATPVPAWADEPLSNLLVKLIQADIKLAPPPAGFVSHEAHFLPGGDQQIAPYFFNQELLTQLATVPVGSSSGGFSYTFNPALGTFQRASESFGPTFAERATTNGKGKVTFGASFQYSKYNSFEGAGLDSGNIKFYLRHAPAGGLFFEGDLIEAALKLKLSAATTTAFVNYGVNDRWDVAVAIPIQHVSIDAGVDAKILRLATGDSTLHSFIGGGTTASFSGSASASGVGDIVVRTKYRFAPRMGGGVAAGVDVRLPTGNAESLLGTGAAAATFTLIGSSAMGKLAPHFNVGYTASAEGDVVSIPNEFGYRFGTEYRASPTVTLAADFLGRSLLDAGRLKFEETTWSYTNAVGVKGSTILHELNASSGTLTLASLALGAKFNVSGNLLISANVVLAVSSIGVTSRFTPVFGFDYSF